MRASCLEAIRHTAETSPDKLSIIDQYGKLTYADYWRRIVSVAADLRNRGIRAGDRVVLITQQDAYYLSCFHGAQLAGAIPVPLERNIRPDRASAIIAQTEAKLTIYKTPLEGIDGIPYSDISFDLDADPSAFSMPKPDAIADILYTTGTTGKIKGGVITHRADVAIGENVLYGVRMKPNNVEIIPMPLNHAFGIRRYFANAVNGSTVVLMDGVVYVKRVFDAFEQYGATSLAIGPSALAILFKLTGNKLAEYKDQLDYIQLGSAHLPDEDKKRLREMLPGVPLFDIYGATEAGCSCVLEFSSDFREKCVGKAAVHAHFKVVDMDGNPIESSPDNPGRLICRGAMNMLGYYKDPETTAETLIDGYIYSNDLSYMDKDGYIYLLGRYDDVITSGGNKIAPQDVEDVANQYAGITDCGCIGVPDEVLGSVGKLFVVPGPQYDENELMAFLTAKLEYYMVPKHIQVISEIPKTFNGKILRRELRKL